MKSPKELEHQIANTRIKPRPEMRRSILEEAFKAQAQWPDHAAGLSGSIWRFIMNSKIPRYVAAAIILIAALVAISQLGNALDGTSVAWAQVVIKCHHFETLTYTQKLQAGTFLQQGKDYDVLQTNYCFADGKHKSTRIARSSRRGDYAILEERMTDDNNQMTVIDHEERTYFTRPSPEHQETDLDIINLFKSLPSKADKTIGNKVIEGQYTRGYFLEGYGVNVELWVNEETHNPVLVEFIDSNSSSRVCGSDCRCSETQYIR